MFVKVLQKFQLLLLVTVLSSHCTVLAFRTQESYVNLKVVSSDGIILDHHRTFIKRKNQHCCIATN